MVPLPRPITSLIGREHELEHLYNLLKSEVVLVTITGFGGIGKTRLALQVALELEPLFGAGVIFAPLASITQGRGIPKAIALTMGLDESVDTVPALVETLGSSPRLLVLDNLEQIPDAAPVVLELLQLMPMVTILATTRSRLEIAGEYVVPLEPLASSGDDPRSLPSVQLFVERANAVMPGLPTDAWAVAVIAEICQKLDGIPLAIELAAARLAIFSLTDLRDQLENILPVLASQRVDMPDRQRTMRNAIAWTYELFEAEERRVFTWLSVYTQDFSLESVAHVVHQLELTDDPLDVVQFLVGRSLIRPIRQESVSPRYHMLQMLREFGHEQLVTMNEDHLARRSHAMDMVALAERAEPHLRTADANQWCAILQRDITNTREAMRWSREHNADEVVLRIIGSTFRFISPLGYEAEFLNYVQRTEDVDIEDSVLVKALTGIGTLQNKTLQQEAAGHSLTRARALAIELAEPILLADALMGLGHVAGDSYDVLSAEVFYREAGEIGVRIGDIRSQYASSAMLGTLKLELGEIEDGLHLMLHALQLIHEQGDSISEGVMAANVAVALQYANRFPESNVYFQRAAKIAEELGHARTKAHVLTSMGLNFCLSGEFAAAREHANDGIALSRRLGITQFEINGLNTLVAIAVAEKDFGAAAQNILSTQHLMLDHSAVNQYILSASMLAEILISLNRIPLAASLFSAARHLRKEHKLGNTFWREDTESGIQSLLDSDIDEEVAMALEEGKQLTIQGLDALISRTCQELVIHLPPRNTAPEIEEPQPEIRLTPRESEVLSMLAQGHSNNEIAEEMYVSTRTVTTHLSNIFMKLDVSNRSKAIAVARQEGLI